MSGGLTAYNTLGETVGARCLVCACSTARRQRRQTRGAPAMDDEVPASTVLASLVNPSDIHDFLRVCYTSHWANIDRPSPREHAQAVLYSVLDIRDASQIDRCTSTAVRITEVFGEYLHWQRTGVR